MAFGLWVIIFATSLAVVYYSTTRVFAFRVGEYLAPFATLATFGLVSFITFWVAFVHPYLAIGANILFLIAVVASFAMAVLRPFDRVTAIAAGLWGGGTIVLLLWAFSPLGGENPLVIAKNLWTHQLPGDNELPFDFARFLLAGKVPSPMVGDWLSSDRPPLQTGFFILTRMGWIDAALSYQIAGTMAQLLVLPVGFHFALSFGASQRVSMITALALFIAPITLVNGIFVWPKLLAAAFLIAAATLHFSPTYQVIKSSLTAGLLVGLLSAAAMLSHGASAFSILAFGMVALVVRRFATIRYSMAAIVAAAAFYTPWIGYQKFADPPGDRLLKWHLAGVIPADDERSVLEAVSDAYKGMSVTEIASRQVDKIKFTSQGALSAYKFTGDAYLVRVHMFFRVIPAMGFVGLFALLALIASLFNSRTRTMALAVITSYFSWILFAYDPAAVTVHTSSYFTLCAAILLLFSSLSERPRVVYTLFAGQLFVALTFFT